MVPDNAVILRHIRRRIFLKVAWAGERTRDLLISFIFSFHHFTAEPQRLPRRIFFYEFITLVLMFSRHGHPQTHQTEDIFYEFITILQTRASPDTSDGGDADMASPRGPLGQRPFPPIYAVRKFTLCRQGTTDLS
jgi:hypothetical protein